MFSTNLAQEYINKQLTQMTEAYKDFEISRREDSRFLLQGRRDGVLCGNYVTEIVALWTSRLFVGGDIDDTVFAYGPKDPIARIYWIGGHTFDSYIMEKAAIGSGPCSVYSFDLNIAKSELASQLERPFLEIEDALNDTSLSSCATQESFCTCVHNSGLIKDDDDAWEWLGKIGLVPCIRVIQAYAACHKLCELLDAEKQ